MSSLQSADNNAIAGPAAGEIGSERRDTERAITLWHKKANESGGLPPITAFDFTRIGNDWGYRFLISSDRIVEDSVFLVYGLQFARVLQLPEKPASYTPMIQQLPERYRPLFAEGCSEAIVGAAPARYEGAVLRQGRIEFYRAAFMPFRLHSNSVRPLIFGSFNYRSLTQASTPAALRRIDNWRAERIRSE